MIVAAVDRRAIIAAARECVGTPFHHHGRLVGVGIDCVGVLVHTAERLALPHVDFTAYRRRPDGRTLVAHLERNLERIEVEVARPGDVLAFWIVPGMPYHVGVTTDRGMVHAWSSAVKVVEAPLTDFWHEHIHSAWRFPGATPWRP